MKRFTVAERIWQFALGLGALFLALVTYMVLVLNPYVEWGDISLAGHPWAATVLALLVVLSALSMLGTGWAAWGISVIFLTLGVRGLWLAMRLEDYSSDYLYSLYGVSACFFAPAVILLLLRQSRQKQIAEAALCR